MRQRISADLKPALIRLAISTGLFLFILSFFLHREDPTEYDIKVIPPTCTDSGYSLYTSLENGSTYIDDIVEALGHDFEEWTVTQEPSEEEPGAQTRRCKTCGETEEAQIDPSLSLPCLYLTGDLEGISKTVEAPITARFVGSDLSFDSSSTLKYQGHSSLRYDKKNFTLKLFESQNESKKYKVTFPGWEAENKYILKANYLDPSQCRNLLCADIWSDMAACRDSIPKELRNLVHYGAVDGFPIALYLNGQFLGLYTMNLHKDDDLFGMEDGEEQAILIANAGDSASLFRSAATFTEDASWEVEFCGTDDSSWAEDKLNALISFVRESDDETFRSQLHTYLDIDSAVDYLLAVYALGLTDHGSDDLILVTYGADSPFIASPYDMEDAFGLSADGTSYLDPAKYLPSLKEGSFDSATGSLLWDRFLELFLPDIQTRYTQLRQDVLDTQALCLRVEAFIGAIPDSLYAADALVNDYLIQDTAYADQITGYISQRMEYLDAIFMETEG